MIQLITFIASLAIAAIATFAWKWGNIGLSLSLYTVAAYLGMQSARSFC